MNTNVQLLASSTILEEPIGSVEVGGRIYELRPPTMATLIAVSGLISLLPEIDKSENSENVLKEVIDKAKKCGELHGTIAATLLLGIRRIHETPMTEVAIEKSTRKWSWKKFRSIRTTTTEKIPVFERDYLAEQLIQELTPGAISKIILTALSTDAIADFFVLTASLSTKSILTATRTEAEETTVSGLSS